MVVPRSSQYVMFRFVQRNTVVIAFSDKCLLTKAAFTDMLSIPPVLVS